MKAVTHRLKDNFCILPITVDKKHIYSLNLIKNSIMKVFRTLRFLTIFVLAASSLNAYSQLQFDLILPEGNDGSVFADVPPMSRSTFDVADLNGDGFNDLAISGSVKNSAQARFQIYINDGNGTLIQNLDVPSLGVVEGSITTADTDGDGDTDIFLMGKTSGSGFIAKLFSNDGNGSFSEVDNTPFEGLWEGTADFADVDGDSDFDLFVTGLNAQSNGRSILYLNDGSGNFVQDTLNFIAAMAFGDVAFGDIDDDGDLDLFLTNETASSPGLAGLYKNDGAGLFTLHPNNVIVSAYNSSANFGDLDGDGDVDLFVAGNPPGSLFGLSSRVYINDGNGDFTLLDTPDLAPVRESASDLADIDGDGDLDLLITGDVSISQRSSRLYENDGQGFFSEIDQPGIATLKDGAVAFFDVDNDADQDLFVTGYDKSQLYANDGLGNFTRKDGSPFNRTVDKVFSLADIDDDSDQDVVFVGSGVPPGRYFLNDGNANFSLVEDSAIANTTQGSTAFADIDGDSDEDLLITGRDESGVSVTELYKNDGNGNFSLFDATLTGFYNNASAFADIDNDNDLDLLLSGLSDEFSSAIIFLYTNDGDGNYTLTPSSFSPASQGTLDFEDLDGDGDLDLFLSGLSSVGGSISRLYLNNGSGSFTQTAQEVPSFKFSAVDFGDVDGDDDLDLLISGETSSQETTAIYLNNGDATFSELENLPFEQVDRGSADLIDIDSDGDLDVFITGNLNDGNKPVAAFYLNDGTGEFTEVENIPFPPLTFSNTAFQDLDGDGDLDLILSGTDAYDRPITRAYRNNTGLDTDGDGVLDIDDECPFDAYAFLDGCDECVGGDTGLDACCAQPFPKVDEDSLMANVSLNQIELLWTSIPGQIGCQIQVQPSDDAGNINSKTIQGSTVSSFSFSSALLSSNTDYEWRVRCGCSQSPLIAGQFTSWQPFTTLGAIQLSSFPNPADDAATVMFATTVSDQVTLEVIDLSGKRVAQLFFGVTDSNSEYTIQFDTSAMTDGVYIYRLISTNAVVTEKVIVSH